jgi:hypothetical protein
LIQKAVSLILPMVSDGSGAGWNVSAKHDIGRSAEAHMGDPERPAPCYT